MKINLIFFISEFNLGGAGNSIFKLCKNLSKKNYKISVICLNKCYYKKKLIDNNIKVYEIKSSRTLFAMKKIKGLTQRLISNNYKNIFVSNIYFSNVLSILFLRSLKMKIILIERTPYQELNIYYGIIDFFKKNFLKLLISLTFSKADICVSNSKFISQEYNKNYNLKFITIHPPSFSGKIHFKNKKKTNDKIIFGTVCRLSKEKNLVKLINNFCAFRNKFIFYIVGDGPERNKLTNLVKRLRLEKEVKFIGKVPPEKISLNLKKIDFYINSSDFEGFPNSVIEALSHNIPVIASQSFGGVNEILVGKKFGYIYNSDYELKEILNKIISHKINFKINKNKLLKHLNKFSEGENYKKYNNLFKSII
ncbi:glycosyltransferase family 4 protein [Candidatus Pelagibacter sp.]|nr:glycosyltransferase family 4 protein [Candidatus Pelagibacter sp.]